MSSPVRRVVINRVTAALSMAAWVLVPLAPSAAADPSSGFRQAVDAARSSSSCDGLHYDSTLEEAAEIVNRSTQDYLHQVARHVPVEDVLPILHDLGSDAGKAVTLRGQGLTEADAIKGAVLQGYLAIPDCSYTRLGVSVLHNADTGRSIVVAVLTGAEEIAE